MSVPLTDEVDARQLADLGRTIPSSSNLNPINFDERLIEALIAANGGIAESLAQAQRLAGAHQEDLAHVIMRLELVAEQALSTALARLSEAPLADVSSLDAVPICAGSLPLDFMREQGVLPLHESAEGVEVAFAFPHDLMTHQSVGLALGAPIKSRTATLSSIRQALERLYGIASSSDDEGTDDTAALDDRGDFESAHLRDLASEAPVVRFVSHLIKRAVDARASDIHIEPFEHKAAIRLRIDGVSHPIDSAVGSMSAVISRIKLLAKLDIAERRLPQDGRLHVRVDGKHVELRASCVPTAHGESLVLRILDQAETRLAFEALGFSEQLQTEIQRAIQTPHGIFLTTGPTGSGKSTTLYTALTTLNDDTKKIITIEDPIERHLQGINQINVKPHIGLTFATALRAIVRQDPDIIMVGEMRDHETATMAIQSALTGHLVLSTLHTNDAASSVTRLVDMGVEPYLVTSTVIGILAQRLVRVLCAACRAATSLDDFLREHLPRLLSACPPMVLGAMGCEHCAGTGFRGRAVVAEFLRLGEAQRELVLARADGRQLQAAAVKSGMTPMFDDGLLKVAAGMTSIDELLRVLPVL